MQASTHAVCILSPNIHHSKLPIAIAIHSFNLRSSYEVEGVGSKSYVDNQWPRRLDFFQRVKVIFHTGSVHNKHSRLCQRLAGRISDAHTPYFSVTPQLQVPHGATAFLHPSIYPPIPLSLWSSSFLSQNLWFRWAFCVRAPAVKHSSSKSNRKRGKNQNEAILKQ